MRYSISQVRKAIVAGVGAGVVLVTDFVATGGEFLPDGAEHWLLRAAAVGTAVGVYLTRNAELIDRLGSLGRSDDSAV